MGSLNSSTSFMRLKIGPAPKHIVLQMQGIADSVLRRAQSRMDTNSGMLCGYPDVAI